MATSRLLKGTAILLQNAARKSCVPHRHMHHLAATSFSQTLVNVPETVVTTLDSGLRVATEDSGNRRARWASGSMRAVVRD
ncbi:hypothetical protein HPB50_020403 [Hyalomma asiaticum]|uniref:Uncharacterized protein n=1 Tax=Hyalomma asiaticum TaxID=266040 RepID=A0ACB7RK41_HYAAI|nr:hypothetical protein HPB50_020403 [Hyalomma asiaticum]